MTDDLIDFVWHVPPAGFQWVTAKRLFTKPISPKESPRYIVQHAAAEPMRLRLYSPLVSQTGLFKGFVDTEPTERGILDFANKFGSLGGNLTAGPLSVAKGSPPMHGESLARWQEAIHRMRDMVTLWELAIAKPPRLSALSRRISWRGSEVCYTQQRDGQLPEFEVIAAEYKFPDILARFTRGDLVTPAMYFVQRQINNELAEHVASAKLLWDGPNLVLRLSATSLIGALWLQFAKAVEGNKTYRQCENCRGWIEVGGGRAARSDKRFCSPSCKSAAYQRNARLKASRKGK